MDVIRAGYCLKTYDTSTNIRTLEVIQIAIEYFIRYPLCEWNHSAAYNATTELPTPPNIRSSPHHRMCVL